MMSRYPRAAASFGVSSPLWIPALGSFLTSPDLLANSAMHIEVFFKKHFIQRFWLLLVAGLFRILQDNSLPFSFVYSVHFSCLLFLVNPPGRQHGSVIAMCCLHVVILFLLKTGIPWADWILGHPPLAPWRRHCCFQRLSHADHWPSLTLICRL